MRKGKLEISLTPQISSGKMFTAPLILKICFSEAVYSTIVQQFVMCHKVNSTSNVAWRLFNPYN